MNKPHPKTHIRLTNGSEVEAIAPFIVSASRSTDIPAFYAEWFIRSLEKGYVRWINPFNQKSIYVSFENARVFVFWTKNPAPFFPALDDLDKRGFQYYFLHTVNDYDEQGFEPGLPPLESRVEVFRTLSNRIGKEKLFWRFDPLILTDRLPLMPLLDKLRRLGDSIADSAAMLIFSFCLISEYPKVLRNLRKAGIGFIEWTDDLKREAAQSIGAMSAKWGIPAVSCAEEIDLSEFGIRHNRCIDDRVLRRLFSSDVKLIDFLGEEELIAEDIRHPLKDKGQRKHCGCAISKDIGRYNTCANQCVYCYANDSPEAAKKNRIPDGD